MANSDARPAGPRILIVEDEAILALALEDMLVSEGYEVVGMAATAAAAVKAARELRPDAILMDVTINGAVDGIAAAERIRGELNCPILFTTAHSDRERLERMRRIPRSSYLPKPYQEPAVTRALAEALRGRRP